ncbi:MAG: hypothetical protein ABW022_25145 [Actinoplanes sp.]
METTTYEYDDAGRVVRSTTDREPEWSEQDRAWMYALRLWRSWQCPIHHGPLSECTSNYETGTQFKVDKVRCRAQYQLLVAQEADESKDHPGSVLWSVSKRE